MIKAWRPGAIGALMDEYERAAQEMISVLQIIEVAQYLAIVDPNTEDPDCKSIETIMNHVVRSGYGYADYIRRLFNEEQTTTLDTLDADSPKKAIALLEQMMVYTEQTLSNKWDLPDEAFEGRIIHTNWNQNYDTEQMLEHAIVHILRHRRQVEKFLYRLKEQRPDKIK